MINNFIKSMIANFHNQSESLKRHDRTYLLGYVHALEYCDKLQEAMEIRKLANEHNVGGVFDV